MRQRSKEKAGIRRTHHKGYSDLVKGSSNKKCRKCGRDPWPNYFYCPECHGFVSKELDIRDINSGGFHPIGV